MRKLGSGFYYKVYDLGNGRVTKKETTFFHKVLSLIKFYYIFFFAHFDLIRDAHTRIKESFTLIPYAGYLFGNPTVVGEYEYEQDKVILLKNYFSTHSFEENKVVCQKYVALVLETWEYGFSDIVYNFGLNAGLNARSECILIDFNEITLNKEKMRKDIQQKKWKRQHSTVFMRSRELKAYVKDLFETTLTEQMLDTIWAKKK
jgi:hypothetical protein